MPRGCPSRERDIGLSITLKTKSMKKIQEFVKEVAKRWKTGRELKKLRELKSEADARIRIEGDEDGSYVTIDGVRIAYLVGHNALAFDSNNLVMSPEIASMWVKDLKKKFIHDRFKL